MSDVSPPPDPSSPRWSVERRLDFIAICLAWERRINRADLVERFGVSPNQATADLKRFAALNPGALTYDTRAKTYRAGPGLTRPDSSDAEHLLRDLRLIAEGVLPAKEGALGEPPPAVVAEPPSRPVRAGVLAAVITAIRTRRQLEAVYQSFSAPGLGCGGWSRTRWCSTGSAGTRGPATPRRTASATSCWDACRGRAWAARAGSRRRTRRGAGA